MKALTIAALFVTSVLLTWIGTISENQADASVNWRDNPERFDGEFNFWDMFFGFAWWGDEESEKEMLAFSNSLPERDLSG